MVTYIQFNEPETVNQSYRDPSSPPPSEFPFLETKSRRVARKSWQMSLFLKLLREKKKKKGIILQAFQPENRRTHEYHKGDKGVKGEETFTQSHVIIIFYITIYGLFFLDFGVS